MTLRCSIFCAFIALLVNAHIAHAQTLDDRLDEDQFLRGLVDYGLPEVLEHYLELHPPGNTVDSLRFQIALQHMRVRDDRLDNRERLAGIEKLLALRTELIDNHKGDARHAVWLTDQAADLFFVLLPVDASGITAMFGLPSPEQQQRAQRVASEMYRAMSLAEIEIEQAILDLESSPGYANDIGLQLQRRRLSSEQRERRIPFLLGLGALMHARFNVENANDQRELLEIAADSLSRVAELLDAPLANTARTHSAIAEIMLGEFGRAETAFQAVEDDIDVTLMDTFIVRIGRALAIAAEKGPQQGAAALQAIEANYATADTLFLRMLLTDQEHLQLRNLANEKSGAERGRALAASLQPYIDLLDADVGVPSDTLRQIVLARLARAIDPEVPIDTLPGIAAIAQAEMLSGDKATRERGIELFQGLLERTDLSPVDRAGALDGLGRALLAAEHRPQAAERFLELATQFASDARAERAIKLSASIAADLYRHAPHDAAIASLLNNCLDVMLSRYQNLDTIDQWKFLAGRVALYEHRFDEAREAFTTITRDSDYFADAQFMRVQATRTEFARASDGGRRHLIAQQLIKEADEVEPILRSKPKRAPNTQDESIPQLLATLAVFRAEAQLELKQPERAIAALENVSAASGASDATMADVTRLRIRAYYESNHPDKVVQEIERLTESAPDEGGPMLSMLLESTQRNIESMLVSNRAADALAAARRELVPLADALANWLKRNTVEHDSELKYQFRIAEAHRIAENFDAALAIYEQIVVSEPEGLEGLLGKAECLYALGKATTNTDQLGKAMLIYRRAGASTPSDIGDAWWLAQLRMLQILEVTGRNTNQIVPRIEQLRQRDANLGGTRFKADFEALQNRQRG